MPLIDLSNTDIEDPLAQFNHTYPNKDGVYKLVKTINDSLDENLRIKSDILNKIFEQFFPVFEKQFKEIIKDTTSEPAAPTKRRDNNELLQEVLEGVRSANRRIIELESDLSDYKKTQFMPSLIPPKKLNSYKAINMDDLTRTEIQDFLNRNNLLSDKKKS